MTERNVLSFIHISDIHFVKSSGDPYDIDEELRQAMLYDLENCAKSLLYKVNGILVCGDLAFSGKMEEYNKANEFLKNVLQVFDMKQNDLYCVVGNHDVDQSVVRDSHVLELVQDELASTKDSSQLDYIIRKIQNDSVINVEGGLLYKPIETYNSYFHSMSCDYTVSKPNWSTVMPLNDIYNLIIFGMNSVLTSNYKDHLDKSGKRYEDGTERKMSINRGQIPKVSKNSIYLSLCHHPPECWNDESLLNMMDSKVKIQLYGHKHQQNIDVNEQRVRISSGALQPERGDNWIPRYNWLEIWLENNELCVKIYPRIYNDIDGKFYDDEESCDKNCKFQLCRLKLSLPMQEYDNMKLKQQENEIRMTTVTTKEIVYLFSILSDRDKKLLLRKFPIITYEDEQEIDQLLRQLEINNIEEDFLTELRNKGC